MMVARVSLPMRITGMNAKGPAWVKMIIQKYKHSAFTDVEMAISNETMGSQVSHSFLNRSRRYGGLRTRDIPKVTYAATTPKSRIGINLLKMTQGFNFFKIKIARRRSSNSKHRDATNYQVIQYTI
jgi:hypothetical protein